MDIFAVSSRRSSCRGLERKIVAGPDRHYVDQAPFYLWTVCAGRLVLLAVLAVLFVLALIAFVVDLGLGRVLILLLLSSVDHDALSDRLAVLGTHHGNRVWVRGSV